jgi:hypothetical protein
MARKIKLTGTLYARPETEFWDQEVLDRYGIAEAFCLYCVPHDGTGTIDVTSAGMRNEFIFWHGTPEDVQDEAREELEYEGVTSRDYLARAEVDRADPRLKTPLSFEETLDDDEEVHPGYAEERLQNVAYNTAYMDEGPAVLDPVTWDEWSRERTAQRRARNLPPIANFGANGLDNLPLFVAAANAIMEPRRAMIERAAERFGYCTAHRLEKRPLERLGYSWNL